MILLIKIDMSMWYFYMQHLHFTFVMVIGTKTLLCLNIEPNVPLVTSVIKRFESIRQIYSKALHLCFQQQLSMLHVTRIEFKLNYWSQGITRSKSVFYYSFMDNDQLFGLNCICAGYCGLKKYTCNLGQSISLWGN